MVNILYHALLSFLGSLYYTLSQHTVKEKIVKFQKPWCAGRFSAAAPIFGGENKKI